MGQEVPKDRRYTMSPEWKEAYTKLMDAYSQWEVQDTIKDLGRLKLKGAEAENYMQMTRDRISRDRETYKTFSTKRLKELYKSWTDTSKDSVPEGYHLDELVRGRPTKWA